MFVYRTVHRDEVAWGQRGAPPRGLPPPARRRHLRRSVEPRRCPLQWTGASVKTLSEGTGTTFFFSPS